MSSIIEHKCNKCSAKIVVDTVNKIITIDSKGPLCDDCIEFIKSLK